MKRDKFASRHSVGRNQYAVIHKGYSKKINDIEFCFYKDGSKWKAIHGDSGTEICDNRTLMGVEENLEREIENGGLMKFLNSPFMKNMIDEFQEMKTITEQKFSMIA